MPTAGNLNFCDSIPMPSITMSDPLFGQTRSAKKKIEIRYFGDWYLLDISLFCIQSVGVSFSEIYLVNYFKLP